MYIYLQKDTGLPFKTGYGSITNTYIKLELTSFGFDSCRERVQVIHRGYAIGLAIFLSSVNGEKNYSALIIVTA